MLRLSPGVHRRSRHRARHIAQVGEIRGGLDGFGGTVVALGVQDAEDHPAGDRRPVLTGFGRFHHRHG